MPITSRSYYKNAYALEQDVISLFGSVLFGAAGAVTSFKGGGITSVVKEAAAGQYTITLSDRFARLLAFKPQIINDAVTAVAQTMVFKDAATLQADIKSDGKITVQMLDFAGAAVNPENGAGLLFEFQMRGAKEGRYDS
jgi:hypothetical protein